MLPNAPSCERNKEPILDVLRRYFVETETVLEIGSGTGQHAVHFARNLSHLQWQTADLEINHDGIHAWLNDAQLPNVRRPMVLDLDHDDWSNARCDAVYSSNVLHIVSEPRVRRFFAGVGKVLKEDGLLAVYGPFNYGGQFTSASNTQFEIWLKRRDPDSGIRDFEFVDGLAGDQGLHLVEDIPMPANNRMLIWRKG